MRSIIASVILSLLIVPFSTAAEAGKVHRSIHGTVCLTSVEVDDYVDLTLDGNMADSVAIDGVEPLMSHLSVKCVGSSMKVFYSGLKKDEIGKYGHTVVRMSADALKNMYVRSHSNVVFARPLASEVLCCSFGDGCKVKGTLKVKRLKIELGGASSFNGSIFSQQTVMCIAGSSRCGINGGACEDFSLYCNDKSQFVTDKFIPSKSCSVTARGNSVLHFPASADCSISLTGSSRYEGSAECSTLSISLNNSSSVSIKGQANTFRLNANGSCSFHSAEFEAITAAEISSRGSSSVTVRSFGTVSVKADGNSQVKVLKCDGKLSISAAGTSRVSYLKSIKVESMKIKDQASTEVFK